MVKGTFHRKWRLATWIAVAFTITYSTVLIFILIFNCTPTSSYWKAFNPGYKQPYHCIDTKSVNPVAGALSLISDVYSILLPCVMVQNLEISRRQKMALNGVFALGLTVVGAGIGRTYAIARFAYNYDVTR